MKYRNKQRKADGSKQSADDRPDIVTDGLRALKAGKSFVQVIDNAEYQTGNGDTASEASERKSETADQTAGHGSAVVVADRSERLA